MYKLKQCQREGDTTSIRMIKSSMKGEPQGEGEREREREKEREMGDGHLYFVVRFYLH